MMLMETFHCHHLNLDIAWRGLPWRKPIQRHRFPPTLKNYARGHVVITKSLTSSALELIFCQIAFFAGFLKNGSQYFQNEKVSAQFFRNEKTERSLFSPAFENHCCIYRDLYNLARFSIYEEGLFCEEF